MMPGRDNGLEMECLDHDSFVHDLRAMIHCLEQKTHLARMKCQLALILKSYCIMILLS